MKLENRKRVMNNKYWSHENRRDKHVQEKITIALFA
jgi:hypothetical protein